MKDYCKSLWQGDVWHSPLPVVALTFIATIVCTLSAFCQMSDQLTILHRLTSSVTETR